MKQLSHQNNTAEAKLLVNYGPRVLENQSIYKSEAPQSTFQLNFLNH